MRTLGIDEAGRGCVLGDLYLGAFCTDTDEATLRAAGAADSKALTPTRRIQAREALARLGEARVVAIPVAAIDGGNLNTLEEAAIVALITDFRPDRVYLDALGHPRTLPALRERLLRQLPADLQPELTIAPKADATWACVGAASIAAKTARDEALDAIAAAWGPVGSGYPSDPTTRAWLAAWLRSGQPWPPFVRTRWATIDTIRQTSLPLSP